MAPTKAAANPLGLPPVVQADPEVKVTRQAGQSGDLAAAKDPILNLPVIQADSETKVTRQTGVTFVDAQGGIRVDRPADPVDSAGRPLEAAKMFVADQRVPADAPAEQRVVPGAPELVFHKPVAAGETPVTRVGIDNAADAKRHLDATHTFMADRPDPGKVHIAQTGAQQKLPPEQVAAYAQGKVFASDTPDPNSRAKPVDFWAQQSKEWQPRAAVPASMKASGKQSGAKSAGKQASAKSAGKGRSARSERQRQRDIRTPRAKGTEAKRRELAPVTAATSPEMVPEATAAKQAEADNE